MLVFYYHWRMSIFLPIKSINQIPDQEHLDVARLGHVGPALITPVLASKSTTYNLFVVLVCRVRLSEN